MPGALRSLIAEVPGAGPVIPDPGIPMQLVHADDVPSALVKGMLGRAEPESYNLAAPGEFTMTNLARELGWRSVPVLDAAIDLTTALVKRLPGMPAQAPWIQTARVPVIMDTSRARDKLGWLPEQDVVDTLRATVPGAQEAGLVDAGGRPRVG